MVTSHTYLNKPAAFCWTNLQLFAASLFKYVWAFLTTRPYRVKSNLKHSVNISLSFTKSLPSILIQKSILTLYTEAALELKWPSFFPYINVRGGSKNPPASRIVHIAAVTNDWKLATLQLFEEGSSYFEEHLWMTASERIKFFFTKSIGGKNKIVIFEAFISSRSHFVECEANSGKQF